jgi:dihydropteroate synthase
VAETGPPPVVSMPIPTVESTVRRWTLRLPRGRALSLGGALRVMGVVNLTPDSFSDGGLWLDPARAVDHGLALLTEGADLLDLGAESTRPGGGVYGAGAAEVPADEEWARLGPVLIALRAQTDAPLSVDTRKGEVARRALDAGADLVNDVSALADPTLGAAVAAAGCPLVLMHSRGELSTMQRRLHYDDLLAEVRDELATAVARAAAAGVDPDQVLLDPGIGFAKSYAGNLTLLARLDAFAGLGRPLLVGASRKSFIGHLTGAAPAERMPGSLAAAAWAAAGGAAVVRVHDVAPTVQFLAVWSAIARAAGGEGTGEADA